MSSVIWSEPPRAQVGKVNPWEPAAQELKRNPGTWARVATRETRPEANAVARNFTSERGLLHQRYGQFEVRTRKLDTDSIGIWARYTGPA